LPGKVISIVVEAIPRVGVQGILDG
jgi:hypothetical protein